MRGPYPAVPSLPKHASCSCAGLKPDLPDPIEDAHKSPRDACHQAGGIVLPLRNESISQISAGDPRGKRNQRTPIRMGSFHVENALQLRHCASSAAISLPSRRAVVAALGSAAVFSAAPSLAATDVSTED